MELVTVTEKAPLFCVESSGGKTGLPLPNVVQVVKRRLLGVRAARQIVCAGGSPAGEHKSRILIVAEVVVGGDAWSDKEDKADARAAPVPLRWPRARRAKWVMSGPMADEAEGVL